MFMSEYWFNCDSILFEYPPPVYYLLTNPSPYFRKILPKDKSDVWLL